jgi:hypothetical protein
MDVEWWKKGSVSVITDGRAGYARRYSFSD